VIAMQTTHLPAPHTIRATHSSSAADSEDTDEQHKSPGIAAQHQIFFSRPAPLLAVVCLPVPTPTPCWRKSDYY